MNNHLTDAEVEMFWSRDADGSLKSRLAEHISICEACRDLATAFRLRQREDTGIAFGLDASIWLGAEHLEYEEKRAYADGLAGAEERAIAEVHLASCSACRKELGAFLDDRRENDRMLSVRHRPNTRESQVARDLSWRFGGLWSPLRAAALILITASVAVVLTRTESRKLLEFFRPGGETATRTIESGALSASANQGVLRTGDRGEGVGNQQSRLIPAADEARVTLSDHGHRVVVEPRITGLSGASDAQLEAITEALIAEDIPLPSVVADLWGSEGALRGERVNPFDLLRPRRELVRDTRPTFRWAPLKDASSYQVFIVDSKRVAVASSGRLPVDITTWRPAASLIRGESYWWSVSATVRGEEVISPGPADAEWKFCVLSEVEHQRLKRIEERTDSHLARGVLYARAGLISESERELQKLLDENQDSNAVRKLLDRVRSWR